MKSLGRAGGLCALALVPFLLAAQPAIASFHLIQIREVYPGSASSPAAEYVELQMYESGQQFVSGHTLRTYDAGGSAKMNVLGSNVGSGASQRTVLVATPEAEAEFGVQADAVLAPSGQLDPAGGAICWESLDCVSWGSFAGSTPSPSGSPADLFGIPDGLALRRSISPRCPTLLEEADDGNDSATDFADAFPAPRPNSAVPDEHPCSTQGSTGSVPEGGSAGDEQKRPQTRLERVPRRRTRDRTPTFRFSSSAAGSTFRCRLDGAPFKRCRSPFTTPRLGVGRHVFRVEARAPGGALDLSPAAYRFRVVRLSGR